MAFKGRIAEKNSAQWKRNEKIINETPVLKRARDVAEGFSGRSTVSSGSRVGGASEAYKAGWEAIFGKKDKKDSE